MSVKFVSPLNLPVATSDQDNNLGQIYFNSSTKKIRVYKNAGWSDVGGSSSGSSGKPGMVTSWAGAHNNVPTGWLLCDGTAVSRTAYADLFGLIGTQFGAGDLSTTFNVPNYINYWLNGAPSSLLTAPNPSGFPASWVSTSGTAFYESFSHSTNGSHGSHATSMTAAGTHNHAAGHTHVATSATSGSIAEGNHTASGVFGFGGAAHTHSVTSATFATSGVLNGTGGTAAGASTHTHVVSFASAASSSNHVVTTTSYESAVSHLAHTHAGGAGTSDTSSVMGINIDHGHTISAIGSSGGHAHATHDPKTQRLYYIIKT